MRAQRAQLRSLIREVIDQVLGTLRHGCAVVREERLGDTEFVVTVQPRTSMASPVTVSLIDAAPQSLFVQVGEASTVELSMGTDTRLREELHAVLSAVTRHGLTERTWRHQGSIVKSEAHIEGEGHELGPFTAQFNQVRLLNSAEIVDRQFSPY